jgi:nucleoside-diphosphate-sugar epimerase
MRALVTGASGFIGRILAEKLRQRYGSVRCLVRGTSRVEHLRQPGVELPIGELLDPNSLRRGATGVDVVFHAAAHADQWGSREECHQANVIGTRNVLEAAAAVGVRRVVYFSTVCVYGHQTGLLSEDAPRQRTGETYADSKVEAEEVAEELAGKHGLGLTVIRPSHVYGPHDDKFIPRVAANILKGRMRVIGSGENVAPVVYGEDVADLALLAAEREAAVGQTFNVSNGEGETWKVFLNTLAGLLGKELPRTHLPAPLIYSAAAVLEVVWKLTGAKSPPPATRYGVRLYAADCRYDISRAERVVGFRPRVPCAEGLAKTVEWLRAEGQLATGGKGEGAAAVAGGREA